jgi:hypothetical protein
MLSERIDMNRRKQNGFARESPARIATGLQARRELTQMIPSFGFFFASIRVICGLFEAKTTNRDPAVPQVGARSPRRAFHQRKS